MPMQADHRTAPPSIEALTHHQLHRPGHTSMHTNCTLKTKFVLLSVASLEDNKVSIPIAIHYIHELPFESKFTKTQPVIKELEALVPIT